MRATKHLLLWTSLGTLALLAWAAYAENNLQEWRILQARYRERLTEAERTNFAVQLRQIVVPALGAADRCVSCHVGMSPGESGVPGDPVFGPHPDVAHDVGRYGCTVCHGGQGRATTRADAHGLVRHWPEPMIPASMSYAGCGACHTHLSVPHSAQLERGAALFERYDCLACHRVDGRGGTIRTGGAGGMEGPDLSRAGATGYDAGWYADHLKRRAESDDPAWRASFAEIREEDVALLEVYMSSRVGAPGLVESKALFHSLGCRGCHQVGGVGGDDGPDLTREGQRDPAQLNLSAVPGAGTFADWLAEHFRAPARVVQESAMPYLGLKQAEIDRLTFYMLSLRRSDFPEAFWPKDRIRAERFGEREFATDGATLYGTYCAACHGPNGEGMRFPGMTAFPAIGNPDFLAIAPDGFVRETVRRGRPGRRMPAWGQSDGGLRPDEIDAVVAHVRAFGDGARPERDPRPARWARDDERIGEGLYLDACASCHGDKGEGGEGPALNNRVLLETATDTYLFETVRRGRRGTSMAAFSDPSPARSTLADEEIEAIVAHIRSWENER